MDNNEFKHHSNIEYSKELTNKEKNFIKSMEGFRSSVQIPMLTDKICVLTSEIKRLNKSTTFFSAVLAFFAIVQIILAIIK